MKRTILTLVVLAISTAGIFAQTRATTIEGKKVILNDEGTWKYIEMKITENPTNTKDMDF